MWVNCPYCDKGKIRKMVGDVLKGSVGIYGLYDIEIKNDKIDTTPLMARCIKCKRYWNIKGEINEIKNKKY